MKLFCHTQNLFLNVNHINDVFHITRWFFSIVLQQASFHSLMKSRMIFDLVVGVSGVANDVLTRRTLSVTEFLPIMRGNDLDEHGKLVETVLPVFESSQRLFLCSAIIGTFVAPHDFQQLT